ncbi:MAG TPA: phospholipid carrier-dependent glycosyltransferase [bacterium]|nr:phospholipid carrier-dependent glycosyltransferase [bacterium]
MTAATPTSRLPGPGYSSGRASGTRKPGDTKHGRHARTADSGQSGASLAGRRRTADPGRFLLPALLGLYVVLSILLFDPKLGTFGDNAIYLILGKSLAGGNGYRDLYLPGAPVHTQYPPGFPVILAGITLLCGGVNVLAAKLFVVLTGIGAMFFIYRLCELTFPKRAWPIMALFASVPALVENNHWVLSEMPFLLATVAALYCLVLADQRSRATAVRLRVGACGLAVAASFIRTAGVAVVLGVLLFFLVRRRYRELVLLVLLFAAATLPWQLHNTGAGHTQPYLEQLLARQPYSLEQGRAGISDWALRVWQNLRDYAATVIPRMLFPTRDDSWYEIISGIILSLLAAIGFLRSFRKPASQTPVGQLASKAPVGRVGALQSCAVFAAPLLLCWPNIWVSERLLLPFLPLVIVFLFYGLDWLGAKLGWRRFAPAFIGALVLANTVHMASLAGKAVSDNLGYLRGDRCSGYEVDWRRYFEAIDWIKAQTPADAVVMARKPEFVYLLSGRQSYCYPITTDSAKIKLSLRRCQYVLADNFQWTRTTPMLLMPVLHDNPGLWSLLFTTSPPKFYVLSVVQGTQVSRPTPAYGRE